jgi:endonuclease/exonuclease/phosphatase family metal-dependent hydrolase
MTYNIHHAAGGDGEVNLKRIADVIQRAKPDLVALQEVDQKVPRSNNLDQAYELGRMTKLHSAFGSAMEYGGGQYGNAVLSRFRIESWRILPLPNQPGGRREPRAALEVVVSLRNGRRIAFLSTHLDHTREPSDRVAQARALAEPIGRGGSMPAVLAGDFNCEDGSPPFAELERRWRSATQGDTKPTAPADKPRARIDHVFVRPAESWKVREAVVVDEPLASDHRPVVVKLELVAAKK